MTILNHTSDGLYSMVALLYRTLARTGPISKDELLALCTVGIEVKAGAPRMESALAKWLAMGLFVNTSQGVQIAPDCEATGATDDLALTEAARRGVLRVVFRSQNVPSLWATEAAADFARGLAWWMAQDAWTFGQSVQEMLQMETKQLAHGELRIVNNDVRMARLAEWARFLGFAWSLTSPRKLELDPAGAIDRVLEELLPEPGSQVAASTFLHRLAERLPVLDNGAYRREVESVLDPAVWVPVPQGWVSSTLGRALRRLRHTNRLDLIHRADAGSEVHVPGRAGGADRPWLSFTHVARKSAES